jgi:serine/threonine protein kinase
LAGPPAVAELGAKMNPSLHRNMQITLQGTYGTYSFDPQDAGCRLGQGGMGIVFKGNHTNNSGPVAIKVLYKEITANISAIERERQSAGIRINNRNLIRMLDFVEQNGIFHIVSELVEGKTLHAHLQELQLANKKMDKTAALNIINQVMDGLSALHSNQPPVIHRDIDPSNIMLCSDGTVKIMDFGIAKISDGKRKSLTGIGTVIGKPHYSPPEQIRGESDKINQTTDIYALGITLYEMLTGNPPFNATNEYDVMKMQIEKPLPYNASIPAPIFRVIQKATEKKQERRYATVADLRRDLNAAFRPEEKADAGEVPVPQRSSKLTRVLLLVFAVGCIGLFVYSQQQVKKYEELFKKAYPITITDIQFGNGTYNGSMLSSYGDPLESKRMRYVMPKIIFKNNSTSVVNMMLMLKYYSEKGNLVNSVSFEKIPVLYNNVSMLQTITIYPSDSFMSLHGFGNDNQSIYNTGTHKLEIWHGDEMLFSKSFYIQY